MTRTENEQEFVLGNKQLLSAFFVVVALLGVFFAMGYTIGRNTAAPGTTAAAKTNVPPTVETVASLPPVTIAPVSDTSAVPDRTAPTPDATATTPAETAKPAPVKAEAKKIEAPVEELSAVEKTISSSAGHTYLQIMAVKRPVADTTVKMLKERGFPALLGESSKAELFRVMVGPYADTETLAKAKSDLKKMGFDSVVSK
jgi:cell division septation protein DedD